MAQTPTAKDIAEDLRAVLVADTDLDERDVARIERAITYIEGPSAECGYECPYTEAGHEAHEVDHAFQPKAGVTR